MLKFLGSAVDARRGIGETAIREKGQRAKAEETEARQTRMSVKMTGVDNFAIGVDGPQVRKEGKLCTTQNQPIPVRSAGR